MAAAIKRLRGGPQALHVRHGSGGARAGEVRDVAYAWGGVAVGIRNGWSVGKEDGCLVHMGKSWESMGKTWETMGKSWEKWGNDG